MKFRKKPVVIDAEQFTFGEGVIPFSAIGDGGPCKYEEGKWFIETIEGPLNISDGDWIIRGVKGEYYPCKPDIFAATYEPAEDASLFYIGAEVTL